MGVMRRWWQVAAVAVLLAVVGVAAGTVQLPLSRVEAGKPRPIELRTEPMEARPLSEPGPGVVIPPWLVWIVLGIGAVAVLVALASVLRGVMSGGSRFRRRALPRRKPAAQTVTPEAEVVAAVDAGLQELDDSDGDPRRAVIACWVRLEAAAKAAGTPRQPGDTSTDLVLRLLTQHHLSRDVLSEFADVYRSARYASRREVDDEMRSRAREALTQLRGELFGAQL